MLGLTGDDSLNGGGGADSLVGGDGNDALRGDDGGYAEARFNDDLDGGLGVDSLHTYRYGDGRVTVDLAEGTAVGEGVDALAGIENAFVESAGNDTLTGIENIDGGPGDDWYTDEAGADSITGGLGSDTVDYYAIGTALRVPMDADLAAGYVTLVETDTVATVENVIATRFGAGDDVTDGAAGTDTCEAEYVSECE